MANAIPSSEQVGASLKSAAYAAVRIAAIFVVAVHVTWTAGYKVGEAVHRLNDWLASFAKDPTATASATASAALAWADRVLAQPSPEPEAVPILTGPELIALWGAEILPDEDPAPAPAKPVSRRRKTTAARTTARRKPAKATKVQAGG